MRSSKTTRTTTLRTPWIGLAVLLLSLTGCAAYRPAALPGSGALDEDGRHLPEIQEGRYVTIELVSGEKDSGVVKELSDHDLLLERSGNYGHGSRTIAFEEIDTMELTSVAWFNIAGYFGLVLGLAWVGRSIGEGLGQLR